MSDGLPRVSPKLKIATPIPLLDNLIVQAGFWVTEALYNRVLQMAGEASR